MNECVGVDVSKQHLDWVFGGEGKVKRVNNTPAGIRGLVAKLRRCEASLIIVESTGGYERAIGEALGAFVASVRGWAFSRRPIQSMHGSWPCSENELAPSEGRFLGLHSANSLISSAGDASSSRW
jgi:hypothetical protein